MIGETLSHYRILERLGSGGMGDVYVAEDLRLGRRVALKLLPAEVAEDPERLERLHREALTLARLRHPSIVTLYEVEEHQGRPVLVMELVDGRTLDRMIPREGLALDRALEIAIPVSDALVAAHEAGVVHRDLKPSNVLVSHDGVVKVCDFGLAALYSEEGMSEESTESFTATGVGTLPYMAPEQLRGAGRDPRSDLFSFGVMLYEMVTGERPFHGETVADLASEILHHEPPARALERASLPADLGRIIRHCLRKDPEVRYQTAKGLRAELLELSEAMHREESRAGRVRLTLPRRFVVPILGAIGLVGTLLVGFLLTRPPGSEDSSRFGDPRTRVLVDQATDYERRGDNRRDLEHAESVLRRALRSEPENAYLKARLAALLARIQSHHPTSGRAREVEILIEQALAQDPSLAPAWAARAQLAIVAGKWRDAETAARQTLELDPGLSRGYQLLGEALVGLGRPEDAIAEASKALDFEGEEARGRLGLAKVLMLTGRYNEAAAQYERVLEVMPDSPNAQNNLGLIYVSTGRELDAVPLLRRALEEHPEDDGIATNLGYALYNLGRYEEAAEAFTRAHELLPDHPSHERNLADTYEAMGDLERMRHWLEEALDDYDQVLRSGGPDPGRLAERGVAAVKLGRQQEARQNVEAAMALSPADPYVLFCGAQVAAIEQDEGELRRRMSQALDAGYPRDQFQTDAAFSPYRGEQWFSDLLLAPGR